MDKLDNVPWPIRIFGVIVYAAGLIPLYGMLLTMMLCINILPIVSIMGILFSVYVAVFNSMVGGLFVFLFFGFLLGLWAVAWGGEWFRNDEDSIIFGVGVGKDVLFMPYYMITGKSPY